MAGETSKTIGELGEELADFVAKNLGWTQLGRSNLDIECQDTTHRTAGDEKKRTHGIDSIFGYPDPYRALDEVLLVEAKAITWKEPDPSRERISKMKRRRKIEGYVAELSEKLSCARRSKEFRSSYGLEKRPHELSGLIFFYVRDSFDEKEFREICKEVSVPRRLHGTHISLVSNHLLDSWHTVFDDLERQALKLHKKAVTEFYYPEFELKKSRSPWLPYVTVDRVFSKFVVARVSHADSQRHILYYFGTYSTESIQRLCAALGRFQLLALPELSVVPLSLKNPIKETGGIDQYFRNNELVIDGKDISISTRNLTIRPLTFNLFA